jgi:outer membrane protein assembly factor BamB
VIDGDSGAGCGLFILRAADGRLLQNSPDLVPFQLVDGDADGLDDLFCFVPAKSSNPDKGGQLLSFRGTGETAWRHLGSQWQAASDFDGDGRDDVVSKVTNYTWQGTITARSGETGQQLYRAADNGLLWTNPKSALQIGDLSGDGTPDFAIVEGYQGSSVARAPFQIISGKTGREFWRPNIMPIRIQDCLLFETRDLDGDGQAEVIYVAELGIAQPGGVPPAPNRLPVWLSVFEGKTGKLRWQQQLNDRPSSMAGGEKVPLFVAYTDLDGDKILDVISPAVAFATQYPELRAYNGRTGEALWNPVSLPGSGGQNGEYVVDRLPRPTAVDLDGDGHAEILVQDHFLPSELRSADADPNARTELRPETTTAGQTTSRQESFVSCLIVLDGKAGAEKWKRDFDTGGNSLQTWDGGIGADRYRSRPLIVRRGNKEKPAICIWLWAHTWEKPVATLVLLDSIGNELWRLPVNMQVGNRHFAAQCHDLNGDGTDELVFVDVDSVQAIDVRTHEPLWKFPLLNWMASILSIEPATEKMPATVVVAHGRQVLGLDGSTGKPWWTCGGLPTDHQPLYFPHPELLRDRIGQRPPCVLYSGTDGVATYYRPVLAGSSNIVITTRGALLPKPARDPRFTRPLPWTGGMDSNRYYPFGKPFLMLSGVVFSGLLVIFPGYLLWQVVWRRRFSLGFFLLVPVAAGLIMVALQLPLPEKFPNHNLTAAKFGLVVLELPALLGLYLTGSWLWRGQWRWPGVVAAVFVIWTMILAGSWLVLDQKEAHPLENYDSQRWWIVLLMSGYPTLVAVACVWLIASLFHWLWRFSRAKSATP